MQELSCNAGHIICMTGASGSGKSAIAKHIDAKGIEGVDVHFFDSVGVPSPAEMVRDFGSGEKWQQHHTFQWLKSLAPSVKSGRKVILEGQMRFSYIHEAFHHANLGNPCAVLIDCDDQTRAARLAERGQPDLASEEMMNWAKYLRREAEQAGHPIIDTSHMTVPQAATAVLEKIQEC